MQQAIEKFRLAFSFNDSPDQQQKDLSFWFKLALITFQLALILIILNKFQIERDQGLLFILPLIFFGFLIHQFLPERMRFPFFLLLSLAALAMVLGIRHAAITIIITSAFIALFHLPVPIAFRIAAVLLGTALLAAIRSKWIPTSWGDDVIPAVASMLMFRGILYLYENAQNERAPKASIWQRLSYFFMLPNSVFLVFPVVDYKNFVRSNRPADLCVLQKGIQWLVGGIVQLLIYRIIYLYWSPAPSEVTDLSSLIIFLLTSYAMLLRVCGQAYLAIGILYLFGFDLPPLFHHYFLATGFSDYWRRTIIYWKDFMMKVFYYRLFFLFRKRSLIAATLLTLTMLFVIVWALHSYQFFWLKGEFPITVVDGLFWGAFGFLVSMNAIIQIRKKNKKMLGEAQWSFTRAFKKSIYGVSFFIAISILWSLWSSISLQEWVGSLRLIETITLREVGLISLVLLSAILFIVWIQWMFRGTNRSIESKNNIYHSALIPILVLLFLVGVRMHRHYAPQRSAFAIFLTSIEAPQLNKRDFDVTVRGYYEPLLQRERFRIQWAEVQGWRPIQMEDPGYEPIHDIRLGRLRPSLTVFLKGAWRTTNRWGMRDKEYSLKKPGNTYRFAILGASAEMGSGVENHEVFEAIVEERLNRSRQVNEKQIEILNFSQVAFDIISLKKTLEDKVFSFQPDTVVFFSRPRDRIMLIAGMARRIESGIDLEYPFLKEIQKKSGIRKGMAQADFAKRLDPYADEIIEWGLSEIATECKKQNVLPVWSLLLEVAKPLDPVESQTRQAIAQRMGFLTLDFSTVWGNKKPRSLQIYPWDTHPNAEAHRMMADLFYKRILENSKALRLQ